MHDPKAYTTRAALAGPGEFLAILNEGANHYTGAIVDIINAAPHDDLPLIIATLHIAADALRTQLTARICGLPSCSLQAPRLRHGGLCKSPQAEGGRTP